MTRSFPEANLSNPTVVRILLAAGESFAEAGYQGASTKEIAGRAGVSKSLLHYHFESKEHILYELQAMLVRNIADSVRKMSLERTPGVDSALAALDELWRMLRQVRHYIPLAVDLWKLAMVQPQLRTQQEGLAAETFDLIIAGIHQTLGPYVDRMSLTPEALAQLLLSTLPGFAMRLAIDPEGATRSLEDFKQLLATIVPSEEN